ncbi:MULTISPECIES: hypothetical protein [Pseudoalteromonas]|uniref:Uncharacterized protein n=1 Tax=Pseudoalteromonas amylolytica TaxID=1859457 RepID=A0A1S1MPE8_9GAMM|nr:MULTISPECIES: hypothetical protein [Pseudoalteromonas]MCF6435462.1 hypothetical protein [Pseudoalteromonas sp. MMG022]OHU88458.1 hypothetical protein BFC16_07120 [Pseudoalteromonas sp. JW3]OHU90301.1 hypothetical protein BET10_12950 [Pseudoalteromonas amylolytica]
MAKGVGVRTSEAVKAFRQPAELKLDKLDVHSLNEELGKSRILEAVKGHIINDLKLDASQISFSLDFGLDI